MTNAEKKAYLSQYKTLDRRINQLTEDLARWRARAEAISPVYSAMPRSGGNGDKVAAAGLTPELLPRGITFRQAETTLVCRKIYCQDLDLEQIPQEVRDAFYKDEPVHRMYIGEVVEIIEG